MTPVRPIPEDLDTPEKIAKAADEYLIEKNLNVLSSVHSVQSTLGKRWTLSGREPDKRAMWKWFSGQLKTTFLSLHACFRPILTVDDSQIPKGTVLSRVANSHLYMVLLQVTTDTARIIIETQVDFDAQDGHRALVALATFYAPMNDGRVDELTFMIMNVHIGVRQDPQPLMLQLQAYREEFFAASGVERDEARLTADLNNSLGDEHHVALSIYHQNPLMDLAVLQNCVQQSWQRSERNSQRVATGRLSLPVAAPAFMKRSSTPPPRQKPPSPRREGGRGGGRGEYDHRGRGSAYRDHVKPKYTQAPPPRYPCQLCKQEGHFVSQCPLLQQAALLVAPPPAGPPPTPARPRHHQRCHHQPWPNRERTRPESTTTTTTKTTMTTMRSLEGSTYPW